MAYPLRSPSSSNLFDGDFRLCYHIVVAFNCLLNDFGMTLHSKFKQFYIFKLCIERRDKARYIDYAKNSE